MARVRPLSDVDFEHLLKLASGLLQTTDGDIVEAMKRAMTLHIDLLQHVREHEVRSELPSGDAVLFVPEDGGLALRFEAREDVQRSYPDIDLTGFDITEGETSHFRTPGFDAGVLEDWD